MSFGLDLPPEGAPPPEAEQHWLLRWLHRLEDAALVAFVLSVVGLQLLQISLRNLSGGGLEWAQPATQMLVLWIAWMGAARASRDGQHVAVDIIAHYTKGRVKKSVIILALGFSTCASLTAAWFCGNFVLSERADGTHGLLNVPMWYYESIIPLALTLIGVRFLLQAARLGFRHDAAR
jgi:TRAP-type C4-dicarboxylate transport system permease small subunit